MPGDENCKSLDKAVLVPIEAWIWDPKLLQGRGDRAGLAHGKDMTIVEGIR